MTFFLKISTIIIYYKRYIISQIDWLTHFQVFCIWWNLLWRAFGCLPLRSDDSSCRRTDCKSREHREGFLRLLSYILNGTKLKLQPNSMCCKKCFQGEFFLPLQLLICMLSRFAYIIHKSVYYWVAIYIEHNRKRLKF